MILGIIVASPSEAKTLLGTEPAVGKVYSWGQSAFLAVAGPGEFRAQIAAENLISKGVGALLSWGVAGGLQPGLVAGDIVLPKSLVGGKVDYEVSRSWHNAIKKRLSEHVTVHEGALAHCESLLTLPEYKQALHSSSSAVAADRESAAIAAVAKKAKVPFLTLKVISDPAEVRLPTAFLDRQSSHLSLFRVLATLGSKPWHWGNMLRLSRCTWRALARLSSIAKKLDLDFMPPAKATRRREAVS